LKPKLPHIVTRLLIEVPIALGIVTVILKSPLGQGYIASIDKSQNKRGGK
jgi:hypothetical protein